ncbi:MAG: polysaccharide pyruvyl transferase family protein [Microbacterium gubbeenense]|uniref:polysaccharide pyruvyl transferase family protein n=1 Tax=Microbacterium gubbeenense TaxID=159896 RepID=UPI003F9AAAC1
MTVDIRGVNTVNKGAQLMLEAAVERLAPDFPLTAGPIQTAYRVRASLGLEQSLSITGRPLASARLGNLIPSKVRRWYGLVADKDLSGVVDASGFAYSDTFGAARALREASVARRWKRRGVGYVMLPQAFGPFKEKATADATRRLLEQADLVFVRDRVSAEYLDGLRVDVRAQLMPDFTIGLDVPKISPVATESSFIAIVPNKKMYTTGAVEKERYVEDLVRYGSVARSNHGLEPIVITHEVGDADLGEELAYRLGTRVVTDSSPRVLKAMIGQAHAVVASRFHAVVGGLSQGVPTLAYGWSHKYKELLRDFDAETWITSPKDDARDRVDTLLADDATLTAVKAARSSLTGQVDDMWAQTKRALTR